MKKKLLLITLMVVLFVCVFALSISAQGIKKFATDEFQTGENITYLEGINVDAYLADESRNQDITTLIDNEKYFARAVLKNADDTYTTYPAWYVIDLKYDWKGSYQNASVDRLNALTDVTGETYEIADVIRVEYPEFNEEGLKIVRTNSSGFSSAKYIRIPSHFTSVYFFNYYYVETVEFAPDISENFKTISKSNFLNCYALRELILPNSVTTIQSEGIRWYSQQSTSALQVLNLGASLTTLGAKNSLNSAKVPGLKIIVPDTLDGSTYNYEYFPTTAVIIFTGTKAQAEAFGFPAMMSYEQYVENNYQADPQTIVYGYSECEAFYGGAHKFGEVEYCHESYVTKAKMARICSTCGAQSVVEEFDPIVEFLGYSIKMDGSSATVGYYINKTSLLKYETEGNTFNYGVVAYVPTAEQGNIYAPLQKGENGVEPIDSKYTIHADVSGDYASIDFVIKGLPQEAVSLIMCMYVFDGEKIVYVCGVSETSYEQVDTSYAVTIDAVNNTVVKTVSEEDKEPEAQPEEQ